MTARLCTRLFLILNMNLYKNIEAFEDESLQGLLKQIKSIPHRFSIISMYGLGSKHFAVLSFAERVKIVKKEIIKPSKTVSEINKTLNKE